MTTTSMALDALRASPLFAELPEDHLRRLDADALTVEQRKLLGSPVSGDFEGHKFAIWYKNENHIVWIDDKPFVTSPDIIALVDAASALYPGCTAATWNRCVFTPAAAILHHAAANDLCPYVRVLNFCSFSSFRRAGGFPTHCG